MVSKWELEPQTSTVSRVLGSSSPTTYRATGDCQVSLFFSSAINSEDAQRGLLKPFLQNFPRTGAGSLRLAGEGQLLNVLDDNRGFIVNAVLFASLLEVFVLF